MSRPDLNQSERIGVGIIGATPDSGWAANAHIPALRCLADTYELRALSTSRAESAKAAAKKFGVADAFDNHHDLVSHPGVDLVIVSVKVPHHRTLVEAALRAGKHVYCEWPLAIDAAEAEELTGMADAQGVVGAVGLQARAAPAVACARQLIAATISPEARIANGNPGGPSGTASHRQCSLAACIKGTSVRWNALQGSSCIAVSIPGQKACQELFAFRSPRRCVADGDRRRRSRFQRALAIRDRARSAIPMLKGILRWSLSNRRFKEPLLPSIA